MPWCEASCRHSPPPGPAPRIFALSPRLRTGLLLALAVPCPPRPRAAKVMTSWGDVIWQHQGPGADALDTVENLQAAVRGWKAKKSQVHFRRDFRILL